MLLLAPTGAFNLDGLEGSMFLRRGLCHEMGSIPGRHLLLAPTGKERERERKKGGLVLFCVSEVEKGL
jgi:hypothetical protein